MLLLKRFLLLLTVTIALICFYVTVSANPNNVTIQKKLAELEADFSVRLGLSATNKTNHARIEYRANERFPMKSTFKMIVIAAVLKKSMTDNHLLQEKITYTKHDLVTWSPITEKHVTDGMTISELCAAAMIYSDNTATNLLVKKLGGFSAVTAFARSIGDDTFRIDNWEPDLNSNPDKRQDTSIPATMERSLQKLTLGTVLAPAQREQLITWMKSNTTGDEQIRSGVPKGWVVADKTGGGTYGISNDIGIIWPPKCAPVVVAIYSIQNKKEATGRKEVIAKATRLVLDEFAKGDLCLHR